MSLLPINFKINKAPKFSFNSLLTKDGLFSVLKVKEIKLIDDNYVYTVSDNIGRLYYVDENELENVKENILPTRDIGNTINVDGDCRVVIGIEKVFDKDTEQYVFEYNTYLDSDQSELKVIL